MLHRGLLVASALLLPCMLFSSAATVQPTGYEGYQVVRVRITDEHVCAAVETLLASDAKITLESETIGPEFVDLRLTPGASARLVELGLTYEVLIEDLQEHINRLYGVGADGRDDNFFEYIRTYDEHVQFMRDLVAAYPDLAEMFSLGDSVEGRPLWALRITGSSGPNKPGVFYQAAQHGDEPTGASVLAYVADHLLSHYDTDQEVRWLLDHMEIYLLPISNPDGYDRNRRKNARGVDLNRNWGGPGAGFAADSNPGLHPFSEVETIGFRDFINMHPNIRVHCDVHGYINRLLWPWGHTLAAVEIV